MKQFAMVLLGIVLSSSVQAGPIVWGEAVQAKGEAVPTSAEAAAAHALKAGDRVPEAVFENADGEKVPLASILEKGTTVLIFYRGGWCPYCMGQLKKFQQQHEAIEKAGGRIVAVCTEKNARLRETAEKMKLSFPVYTDPGVVASRAFGVAWANARYAKALAPYQNNANGEIPLGVTYIIDHEGKIRWAYLEDDYKKRATPEQVIEALATIDG